MSDIVERLRSRAMVLGGVENQAADEIERLRGRVAEAEGREQLLLRRCDELEGDRNESDGEVERLRSLIAEARDYIIKNAPIEDKTVGDLVNRLCSALR